MKNNVLVLLGILFVPLLLFGQNASAYIAVSKQNNLNLSANDQIPLNNADTIMQYDVEPKLLKKVEPKYPKSMLKDFWEADVNLKTFIDMSGNVTDAQSMSIQVSPHKGRDNKNKEVKSPDGKEFVDSAIAAARQWKFYPAQKQRNPVATWVTIPFRYRMTTGEEDDSKDSTIRSEYTRMVRSTGKIIDDVLKGTNMNEVIQQHLSPDAYIIFGNRYTSLYGVFKNEVKDITLVEGEKSRSRFLHFILSDDKTTLIIIRKSQIEKDGPERYHTILFVKSKQNNWEIKHWHVSW